MRIKYVSVGPPTPTNPMSLDNLLLKSRLAGMGGDLDGELIPSTACYPDWDFSRMYPKRCLMPCRITFDVNTKPEMAHRFLLFGTTVTLRSSLPLGVDVLAKGVTSSETN